MSSPSTTYLCDSLHNEWSHGFVSNQHSQKGQRGTSQPAGLALAPNKSQTLSSSYLHVSVTQLSEIRKALKVVGKMNTLHLSGRVCISSCARAPLPAMCLQDQGAAAQPEDHHIRLYFSHTPPEKRCKSHQCIIHSFYHCKDR